MLPLENLDKKNFKEILKESRNHIHRFSSEWTDENYHDPGMTLLEMFSWLTEMQRYYLNRVTDKNYSKFLKIYGIELENEAVAQTHVTFTGVNKDMVLPRGTKLLAEDQVFETCKKLNLTSNTIEKVITSVHNEEIDNTHLSFHKNIFFYAFGEKLRVGNKLYIGFREKFEMNQAIEMFISIFSNYPVELNGNNKYSYGTRGSWYTYTTENKWQKISILTDTTDLFCKTGIISLKMDRHMKRNNIDMSFESSYWIMFQVEDFGAHVSPRIETIKLNTTRATNVDNKCSITHIKNNKRETILHDYISIYGTNIIQYERDGYWIDMEESLYKIIYEREKGISKLYLDDTYENLRIISYEEKFKYMKTIGSGNGLPNQRIVLKLDKVRPQSLVIQVGQLTREGMKWTDFTYVDNLISSGPYDNHFMCDFENEMIVFGNGEKGHIPEDGHDNIRVICLSKSNRERGNVKEGEIKEFVHETEEFKHLGIKNIDHGQGGKSPMTIDEGKKAVIDDFERIHRAVSVRDYEKLVREIPGIRVGLARAIPSEENTVNIVVVPYTGGKNPMPDKKLLNIVKDYLEDYRLITTNVVPIEPSYVEIFVKCIISTENNNKFNKIEFEKRIKKYLSPITPDEIRKDYKIGSPLYKSEILKIINEFQGVKYVKKLWIDGKGIGIERDKNGNIHMDKNGIYFCGHVDVELID
ncbi:MAG: baseplate J/gp47 family protein [Anaeromicrobium sp.]|jgi:hypothetical protein|uniref:baseplate J/gp47 family protein n=1 Tax=Anaeromicrobium sp. TaxID=1929132 RepID=UPI0025F67F09|nr:baseplate J/gp47 family protein [Anaeromicrobium sp.]MCT4593118.1 baseplate J/gp47 family protein [Anaeromicrobium sp.]